MDKAARDRLTLNVLFTLAVADQIVLTDEKYRIPPRQLAALAVAARVTLSAHDRSRFHSLRVTYVTELVRAGIHPRVDQSLARHSTITLTMASYTKLEKDEIAAAVDSLPAVPAEKGRGVAKR